MVACNVKFIHIYELIPQELYHRIANIFQAHAFFYQSHPTVVDKHAPVDNVPALFVYKESSHYNFTGESIEAEGNNYYFPLC